jgi:hypothetical protein
MFCRICIPVHKNPMPNSWYQNPKIQWNSNQHRVPRRETSDIHKRKIEQSDTARLVSVCQKIFLLKVYRSMLNLRPEPIQVICPVGVGDVFAASGICEVNLMGICRSSHDPVLPILGVDVMTCGEVQCYGGRIKGFLVRVLGGCISRFQRLQHDLSSAALADQVGMDRGSLFLPARGVSQPGKHLAEKIWYREGDFCFGY